ncbi:MAG TPA: T9SS type A sorting domain-containing protein [Phnomibacter sp.]|nr:T9SS type A sorting domain-containing protein [Phnomibacter sp.]
MKKVLPCFLVLFLLLTMGSHLKAQNFTGNVFRDYKTPRGVQSLPDEVNIDGTPAGQVGTQLYVQLINRGTGEVVAEVPLGAGGTFSIPAVGTGYDLSGSPLLADLQLTQTSAGTLPTARTTPTLPSPWIYVIESDGQLSGNGIVNIVPSFTGNYFGIQRAPLTDGPKLNTITETISIGQLYKLEQQVLTGNDPDEDGALGPGDIFRIESNILLPVGSTGAPGPDNDFAELYYIFDNGAERVVGSGDELVSPPYNENKLFVRFKKQPPINTISGFADLEFTFTAVDRLGIRSLTPQVYTIRLLTVLPATGFQLTGRLLGNDAELTWTTLTEAKTKDFRLQRSIDGVHYADVTTVAASGNSNTEKRYSAFDRNLKVPEMFYRVELHDVDGKVTRSNVVVLKPMLVNALAVFPNPVETSVNINFAEAGNYQVDLVNAAGARVLARRFAASTGAVSTSLNRAGLPAGIYHLRVVNEKTGAVSVVKLLLK